MLCCKPKSIFVRNETASNNGNNLEAACHGLHCNWSQHHLRFSDFDSKNY